MLQRNIERKKQNSLEVVRKLKCKATGANYTAPVACRYEAITKSIGMFLGRKVCSYMSLDWS